MREIIFRGKRCDNGEWFEGSLILREIDVQIFAEQNHEEGIGMRLFRVDPATVGQYTGLKDTNGKRIFEGDIVIYDNTSYNAYGHRVTGEIVWRKWAWRFKYMEYGSVYYYGLGAEDFFGAKSEIIGNIHDNPELIGGTE